MQTTVLPGQLRTHTCGELRSAHIGQDAALCGWVSKVRDLGGLLFIDVRDKYGLTQLNLGALKDLKTPSLESVIKVTGKVQGRPESARNGDMPTGEVEVAVESFEVLSEAAEPPFLPFGQTNATEDLRLKYRYLDLRTNRLQDVLALRSNATRNFRETLYGMGFTEVETPILYKTTPEGARDYVVPSRVHPGKVYALPQSPQTLKQLLMIGSTDRYFQISRCFRDEDLRAERQPEFTQVDLELSFVTEESVHGLIQEIVRKVFNRGSDFSLDHLSYDDAMADYGSDKPDLRFGLKHMNATNLFVDSDFSTFKAIANSQGLIKAMGIPHTFARKEIDAFGEVVKPYGGKGVAWFKRSGGEISGGISKFLTSQQIDAIISATGVEEGTFVFCADGDHSVAHACADALRRHLGKALELASKEYAFAWVHSFPLFDYSEQDDKLVGAHHPFTMPKMEHLNAFFEETDRSKLLQIKAQAYDLVCNGYEAGGGSVRIFDSKVQEKMFEHLSLTPEERDRQFGFFIEALKYGVPPHAGFAFGLDRVIMLLAKTESIRDVIAFPKTNAATDLMASAPSVPNLDQLKELGITLPS